LNPELCKKALEIVGNPNVLINLVSRRVRQLNSVGGGTSRPLIADTANMGAADIALVEIVEGKMGWDLPAPAQNERPSNTSKKRKKH
jgi:DNA-directed RNA polymerase subunit omega